MAGVLFVVMPFGACDAPQVGVSTMQAQLKAEGVPCDIAYLNLLFAQGIGLDRYTQIGLTSGEVFAGEWLFASDLFPQQQRRQQDYVQHVLGTNNLPPAVNAAELMGVSRFITPFLDHCMAVVNWDRYAIVGFTSMFEQNLASLALARRIKERYPTKIIAMGGANCFGPMGLQLHKSFPFLDFVFTGEADLTFPTVARRLLNGQSLGDDLQGYVRRENGRSIESGPATCLKELDRLPYPDYDDFYAQFAVSQLPRDVLQYLLLETSRGCWWGQKNQCRFCGISHAEIPYRSKSPERALNEMLYLGDRYGIRHLMTVDNILRPPLLRNTVARSAQTPAQLHTLLRVQG